MAKYKLSIDDFEPTIVLAFGLYTQLGPLKLSAGLNKLSSNYRFRRYSEDLYDDFKGSRFYYPVFYFEDPLREIEWKLVQNRSYRSESQANNGFDLFSGEAVAEKNWLNTRDGFDFFLWFEGENQNVSFLHEVKSELLKANHIAIFKELKDNEINKLTKSQKYYHGL